MRQRPDAQRIATDLLSAAPHRPGSPPSHAPVLYDQHIRYLNFTRFDRAQPTYINMVREPVARAVST